MNLIKLIDFILLIKYNRKNQLNYEWVETGNDLEEKLLVDGKIILTISEKYYRPAEVDLLYGCSKESLKIANKKDYEITDIAFNTEPKSNLIKKIIFFLLNFSIIKNQSFPVYC